MDHKQYVEKCRQDPAYRRVEERLGPILDLADEALELRIERGWTQAELAERVGTAQANISRLENGLANPTLAFLCRLSEAFGTQLSVRLRSEPAGMELEYGVELSPILAVREPGSADEQGDSS